MNKEKNKIDTTYSKLTTEEAKLLINMLKERVTETTLKFPNSGKKLEFDVFAQKDGTKFVVNICRGSIDNNKCSYQGRTYINSTPILRLDITDSYHRNSDGTKISGNHLHIYNEETAMAEAIPFDITRDDLYGYCLEFFKRFNIIEDSIGIIYQMEF